jgi:hypothetical protein
MPQIKRMRVIIEVGCDATAFNRPDFNERVREAVLGLAGYPITFIATEEAEDETIRSHNTVWIP